MSTGDPALFFSCHAFVCTNVRPEGHPRGSCARKNSVALRDYMKDKAKAMGLKGIRINAAGCLDRCELGPNVVIYPEGIWYTIKTEADVDEVLETHVKNKGRVARLMLQPEDGPKKS